MATGRVCMPHTAQGPLGAGVACSGPRRGRARRCHTQISTRFPRRGCRAAADVVTPAKLWSGPPDDFKVDAAAAHTLAACLRECPDLADLARSGDLIAFDRPEHYQERRDDDYREPEEIWVFGVAHGAKQSERDAKRVIEALQPQAVVVELCRSRSGALYLDELAESDARKASSPLALSGKNLLSAFTRAVSLGGNRALLVQALLNKAYSSVVPDDVTPGSEFTAARQAADDAGAQIVLGDRPIQITIDRILDNFTWRHARRLAGVLLAEARMRVAGTEEERAGAAARYLEQAMPATPAGREARDKLLQHVRGGVKERESFDAVLDAVASPALREAWFQWLNGVAPELLRPLLHERDLYLAWSLKRSKAVNGKRRVVGIVGKAHLRGILFAMQHDPHGELRFRDLVGGRNTREFKAARRREQALRFVRDTVVFSALAWYVTKWGLHFPWQLDAP